MRRARVHRSLRVGELVGVAVIVCSLTLVGSAYADGKVFSTADYVAMPHQSATLAWRDGEVFLAIEPAFAGKGSEFAWIVPVPGEVEIEPVTPGTFAMLRRQTAVRILPSSGNLFLTPLPAFYFLISLLLLLLGFKLDPRTGISQSTKFKHWCIATTLALPLPVCVMMPSLSSARGPQHDYGVSVISRSVVGSYDTAVLSAINADTLTTWLIDNGFHIDDAPTVRQAANEYIADGWRFVAVRMRGEQVDGSALTAHPLGFRYRAATPVYPLRLTGAGFPKSERLNVELFVFGEQQAAIDGWTLAYSGTSRGLEHFGVQEHLGIGKVSDHLPVWTRLRASLKPKQMRQDAVIHWRPHEPFRESVLSPQASRFVGANVAAACLLVLVPFVVHRDVKRGVPHNLRDHAIVVALCAAVAFIVPLCLPQASAPTNNRWGEYRETSDHFRGIYVKLSKRYKAAGEASQPVTLEITRQWLTEIAPSEQLIGDGPGQCEMIQTPGGILTMLLHRPSGHSVPTPLGPASAAD